MKYMNNAVLIDIALFTVYSALLCDKNMFVVHTKIIIIGYCPAVYLISKSKIKVAYTLPVKSF